MRRGYLQAYEGKGTVFKSSTRDHLGRHRQDIMLGTPHPALSH